MTVRTGLFRLFPSAEDAALLVPAGAAAGVVVAAYGLGGASVVGLLLHVAALGAVTAALLAARRRRREADRMGQDLDAVSHRLLRLETLFADAQRQDGRSTKAAAAEVSGEIALLGNLVRDLAETVAAHDRDLSRLAGRAGAAESDQRIATGARAAPDARGAPDARAMPAGWADPAAWGAPSDGAAPPEPAKTGEPRRAEPPAWAEFVAQVERARAAPAAPPPLRPTLSPDDVAVEADPLPPGWLRGSLDAEPFPDGAPSPRFAPVSERPATGRSASPGPPAIAAGADAAPFAARASAGGGRSAGAAVAALEADRLDIHLQPIVTLPQRKVRAYEVLARLRGADDALLAPADFLPALEAAGRAEELDRRVLGKAAAVAGFLAGRGSDALLHCNLSPRSLSAPALRALGRALDAHPALAGRLVLEIPQRAWREFDGERAGAMSVLHDRGALFALDRATDGRLDPQALADRGVRFVKLPADLLLRAGGPGPDLLAADLSAALGRAGIRLIAERVERAEDVPDLIELDVPLAQGFAFAPPRPVRTDLGGPAVGGPAVGGPAVGGPAAGAATAARPGAAPETASSPTAGLPTAGSPTAGPGGERVPYRSFLRRAG